MNLKVCPVEKCLIDSIADVACAHDVDVGVLSELIVFLCLLMHLHMLKRDGVWFWDMPVEWQAATVFFAVLDLVAAIGLWLAVSWGAVMWLLQEHQTRLKQWVLLPWCVL